MFGWNWRLYQDKYKDSNGIEVDRIRFQEIWYVEKGVPNSIGDYELKLEEFGEAIVAVDKKPGFPNIRYEYEPIDIETAKENIKFTLNKLLEALDKPVLTTQDFSEDCTIQSEFKNINNPRKYNLNDLLKNYSKENARKDPWETPDDEL